MSRVAAICMVRNAVDLVPWSCGHYLRMGCDRIAFIDDHSDDGTFELLERFSRHDRRVMVERSPSRRFDLAEQVNRNANAQIAAGHEIIVPFDVDEFWPVTANELRTLFGETREAAIVGQWTHFVQQRDVGASTARNLLKARHRAPVIEGTHEATVRAMQRSFLCHSMPKVIVRSSRPVQLALGQHAVLGQPVPVVARGLELFHVPLRSRDEIVRRGQGRLRIREVQQPGSSWQADHFAEAVEQGRVDEVWAANSVDKHGWMQVGTERVPAPYDPRLRNLLWATLGYLVRHRLPLGPRGPAGRLGRRLEKSARSVAVGLGLRRGSGRIS